ncbi:family 31 glycosyl hydrolase, alpha-glucosidase [Sphaerochaeta pleomorpha str. Grapes]|uniref:Family 31 glycosyl hydrolase, alpha-glucosidase n=1 Tax=Sphaerochaeta pleomorpha (strain ATCC BAA-1885 / DSM 22778 / Grapes) TaxID=158190 RepID=G8QRE3_SPHPG|nr:TIM-barrel domain-containing protein [Sphaerochaeta pleomorpha]AEV28796.1 family 31 glycosyl hydrolase, alpha-glucosidase [Sphaerochaeta pleomorpha str. Grapes]
MNIHWNLEPVNLEYIARQIELSHFSWTNKDGKMQIQFTIPRAKGIWGFGERFDAFNQEGLQRKNQVVEHFTQQGQDTYLPVPFFLTDSLGFFLQTRLVCTFVSRRTKNGLRVTIVLPVCDDGVYFFSGNPQKILAGFLSLQEKAVLPPSWAFGPWMSANRWNDQETVLKEAEKAATYAIPATVLVIEAWSDEATFYRFNEGLWPDPKKMIEVLHRQGLHLILWQIPVLKKLDAGQVHSIHEADCQEAIANALVVTNPDGTPYHIPKGKWFAGGMVPDFTNPHLCQWWFKRREYLLEMGVDGFKTDGGEFIYTDEVRFHDGSDGTTMQNEYPLSYTKAYAKAIGKDRILFSRSGYVGSQATPLHWVGDQLSIWPELPCILHAGLNASVSGIPFWGFDIGGFAGPLPSAELYLRSFMLATFWPVMQWHSEPLGGQFSQTQSEAVNDRSPWNMAKHYNDDSILAICRKFSNLRMELLPYIESEAAYSVFHGEPLMRPLFYSYPEDDTACAIEDEYLFGRSLLIAPILTQGDGEREIYLPQGSWLESGTKEILNGPCHLRRTYDLGHIGVFLKLDFEHAFLKGLSLFTNVR